MCLILSYTPLFKYYFVKIAFLVTKYFFLLKKGTKRTRDGNEKSDGKPAAKEAKVNSSVTDFSQIDFTKCDKKTENGEDYNFKISSWNVAGLRACIKVDIYV